MTDSTVTTFQDNEQSLSSFIEARCNSGSKYSLWKTASSIRRNLIARFLLLFFVLIIFAVIGYFIGKTHINEYCLTPLCVKTAAAMLASMDTSADPCTDFYQYACGRWSHANARPEGLAKFDTMAKLQLENDAIIKNILEDPNFVLSGAEEKARTYYYSCLGKNGSIEELKTKPLLELIDKIGGWNISGDFNVNEWNFQKTLELLQEYNMEGLFSLIPGEKVIWLEKPKLGLPTKEYYINKSIDEMVLGGYLRYMTEVGVLLGGERNSTREQMKNVIEFETLLANMEDGISSMNITELSSLVPYIDWLKYFNSAFEMVDIKINDSQVLHVHTNLFPIMTEYWSTPEGKIVLNNYLIWMMVNTMVPYMSESFRAAHNFLLKPLEGIEVSKSRWMHCVEDTSEAIGFALGAMFVRETFHENSKYELAQMFSDVRKAFVTNVLTLSWVDEETAKEVTKKAEAITIEPIGYPSYILEPEQLNQKYEGLEFSADKYFQNNIRARKFKLLQKLPKLGKPQDYSEWTRTPSAVGAYYLNTIRILAGIIRPPYYEPSYPKWLKFGGIGFVMGHELGHGFEHEGLVSFEKDTQQATKKIIAEKIQCYVDQYSTFEINGEYVKGKKTQRDNIADNIGLKFAYYAYQDWILYHKSEPALPVMNLTNNQLFFVAFAQLWCGANTKEESHLLILKDEHAPIKYRVIGAVSNSEEFAREFHCSSGSPMNPKDKCELW